MCAYVKLIILVAKIDSKEINGLPSEHTDAELMLHSQCPWVAPGYGPEGFPGLFEAGHWKTQILGSVHVPHAPLSRQETAMVW